MAELQISVPDAIGEYADAQVASGRFPTMDDYVGALVRADEQAQRVTEELSDNQQLAAMLEDGLKSGQGRRWSPVVLNEIKEQLLNRGAGNRT